MEVHEKIWGREAWIVNNSEYCGKMLIVNKGFSCSVHMHKLKHETFFLLSGCVYMEHTTKNGHEEFFMFPGDSVTIERGESHRFTGMRDLNEIIEFSTQHFEDDSYRSEPSGKVDDETMERLLIKLDCE